MLIKLTCPQDKTWLEWVVVSNSAPPPPFKKNCPFNYKRFLTDNEYETLTDLTKMNLSIIIKSIIEETAFFFFFFLGGGGLWLKKKENHLHVVQQDYRKMCQLAVRPFYLKIAD